MSASDDRTVRLWTLALSSHSDEDSQQQQQQQQHEVECLKAAQVLYGHSSRLWDCQFGEKHGILVTASEDCTARVWDMTNGKQLCSVRGHKGRGVWRCLLHPNHDLLVTAGADSSIKLWRLADWLPAHHPLAAQASDAFSLPPLPVPAAAVAEAAAEDCAVYPVAAAEADAHDIDPPLPASSIAASRVGVSSAAADIQAGAVEPSTAMSATDAEGQTDSAPSQPSQQDSTTPDVPRVAPSSKGRDSKVEWVRCFKLADESTLFVGTNLGCLYSVNLPSDSVDLPSDSISLPSDSVSLPSDSSSSSPEWHLLYNSPRRAAITSLQVLHPDAQDNPQGVTAPAAQHSIAGSGMSAEAELQNLWVVFGDIQGVVTCLRMKQADVHMSRHQSVPTSHASASSHNQSQLSRSPLASQDNCKQPLTGTMTSNQGVPWSTGLRQPGDQQLHGVCSPSTCVSWEAHSGKPVLRIFTVPAFGPRHVFSTSVTGTALRWWHMPQHASLSPSPLSSPYSASSLSGSPGQVAAAGQARLLAEIRGPVGRGSQIVALDACPKRGLLMCGDMSGNVMGFVVPPELLQSVTAGKSTPAQMQPCAIFRQQHAKSVMIVKLSSTDIMSAGNDGRICRYHWQGQSHGNAVQPQTSQRLAESNNGVESHTSSHCVEGTSGTGSLQCVAEERLSSIATVLDVVTLPGSQEQLVCGFQSSDWVVFNTTQQLELMRVPCGGWHRPFTFHCLSLTHLVFIHYQPRSSSTHVHRRCRPVPPLLTPAASDGGPRGLEQGAEGSEGLVPGSEGGEQRLRESACGSQGGADGSCAGVGGLAEPMTGLHAVHHGREVLCCALLPSFRVHSLHAASGDSAQGKSPSSSSALPDCSSPASRPESFILHTASCGNDDPSMPAHHAASSASPLCLLTGSEDGTMRQLLYNPEESCPGQASQSPNGQHPPGNGELQLNSRQTQSHNEQPVNGQNMPKSQQSGIFNGQNGSSSRQSAPDSEQDGSTAGGNGHPRGLFGADEVGFQAAGSAVKSIVTIPAGPGLWLVVTAGAKEVLMAWLLQWKQNSEGKWHLSHHWLSTRPPPHRGLRPVANAKGQNSVSSDLRCMALAGWSKGTLQQGDLEQGRSAQDDSAEWQTIQQLHHHTTPVLALCTLPCPPQTPWPPSASPSSPSRVGFGPTAHADRDWPQSPAAHQQNEGCSADQQQQHSLVAQLVFSGATNGSIAAWRVVESHSRVCTQQQQQQQQQQQGSLLWSEERWHQSGVNAMHAAVTPGKVGCLTMITGGDDQAVHVAVFQLRSSSDGTAADGLSSSLQLTMLCRCHVHSAHTSAIRGLWTDGSLALTVALDQRLHSWRLMYDQHMAENAEGTVEQLSADSEANRQADQHRLLNTGLCLGVQRQLAGSSVIVQHSSSGMTQVLEPAALDACVHDSAILYIIVAGRGTQLMSVDAKSHYL
ncbi:TPA: hypothetical protein ACH3X1_010099 [Trebouxia sp. C0004]